MKALRWKQLTHNPVRDFRIFRLKEDTWKSPNRAYQQNFISIEAPNWVNIVALTREQQVVCVRQWRAGTDTVELEIPGGVIDPADASPLDAGIRELREETGFTGRKGQVIGEVFANPAIQNNTCFTVFVSDCQLDMQQDLDAGEEIEIVLIPLDELESRLRQGQFRHSLVVAAFQHFLLKRDVLVPE